MSWFQTFTCTFSFEIACPPLPAPSSPPDANPPRCWTRAATVEGTHPVSAAGLGPKCAGFGSCGSPSPWVLDSPAAIWAAGLLGAAGLGDLRADRENQRTRTLCACCGDKRDFSAIPTAVLRPGDVPRLRGGAGDSLPGLDKQGGRIEMIIGPMFAGKSTELMRRIRRHQLALRK